MDILHAFLLLISYLVVFLFLILVFFIIKIFAGKSINNPNYAPVKGTVFNQFLYFDYLYDYQLKVTQKQPTYRLLALTRSEIFTTDVRNIEYILKTNFKKYTKGKYREEIAEDLWGEGLFTADGDKWQQQRKLIATAFSAKVVTDFSYSIFRKHAVTLVGAVSNMAASGQAILLQDILKKCTFHSIFEVGFGIDLNALETLSDEGTIFMKAFDDANESIFTRFFNPFWKLQRFLGIGSEVVNFTKNVKIVDDFLYNVINTKKELLASKLESDVKDDLLSRLLREREKNPKLFTDKYIRDIILGIVVAGKDSNVIALSWLFYMLCKYPLVQEKVAKEVMDITNSDGNTADVEEFMATITNAALDQMHYLHAVISETLRLFPPIAIDARHAEEDDILPDGHRVKGGDEVNYLTYAMARLPYIWGEDAHCFRPERWLKDGVFQSESPFKFVTFHAGPQICLGRDFTYRQMKIYASALIVYFRFKLADGMDDLTYKTAFDLKMNKDLYVCAVPRTIP